MCAQNLKLVIICVHKKRKPFVYCLRLLVRKMGENKVLDLYFCIFNAVFTLQYEVSWRHSPCFTFTQYHPHIRQRHTWWAWQCGSIVTLCYSKPFSCVVRVGHTFSTRWCCCVVFYWCVLGHTWVGAFP